MSTPGSTGSEQGKEAIQPTETNTTKVEAALQATSDNSPTEAKTEKPVDDQAKRLELLHKARKAKQEARRREELRKRELELTAKEARLKALEEVQARQKSTNPEDWLKQGGFTYDQLVEHKLNGGKVTSEMEIQALREELNKTKQTWEEKEKEKQEQELKFKQTEAQEVIENFKQELNDYINDNSEAYELTKLFGMESLLFDTIEAHWQRELQKYNELTESGEEAPRPRVMSKKEAADLVEGYAEEQAEKWLKSKKYAKKYLTPKQEEPKKEMDAGYRSQTKTMNNSMAGQSVPSTSLTNNSRVQEDAFKRALAKLG